MANNSILSEFSQQDVSEFKKDMMQMVKVGSEIDRVYAHVQSGLDIIIPKFENLVAEFNKKYKGIKLKIRKTIEHLSLKIYIPEPNAKDMFANSASRISGLKSVGRNNFNQIDMGDMDKFAKFLDTLGDSIYAYYSEAESGTSTLSAVFERKEGMIEIVYETEDMMNENSASFKVCAYYAMKGEIEREIDIITEASTFGFYNLLDEIEKREWNDRIRGVK